MKVKLIFILLLVFFTSRLPAQWNWSKAKLYTNNDGLFEREITGVAVDSKNMVWMSTPSGVYLFDGHDFFPAQTVYPQLEKYFTNYISGIIYNKARNEIWFTTITALYRIALEDFGKNKNPVRKIFESFAISSLSVSNFGAALFIAGNQLYHININDTSYTIHKDEAGSNISNIFFGHNNNAYIIQPIEHNSAFSEVSSLSLNNNSDTSTIIKKHAGLISKLYIDSLIHYGQNNVAHKQKEDSYESYKTIIHDSLTAYNIITPEMDNATWILNYYEEGNSNLWIATVSGLIQIPATRKLFHASAKNFEIRSIFYNPKNKRLIYSGPAVDGLYSDIGIGTTDIKTRQEAPDYFNASLLWNDSMWIAFKETYPESYYLYNPFTDQGKIVNNLSLQALFSCQKINGQLWSGAFGVIEISNLVNNSFIPEKSISLTDCRVLNIAAAIRGNTLAATTNGLYMINIATLEKKLLMPGFFYCATSINEEKWAVGSSSGGLYIVNSNGEISKQVTVKDGMPHITVYNMAFDSASKTLFCGTKQGLVAYSVPSGLLNVYTTDDGLTHNEFNAGAVYISPDRILFDGGLRGVNYIPIDSLKTSDLNLLISKFLIRGVKNNFSYSSWNMPASLVLDNDLYNISISFTNTGTANQGYYRYRIVGGKYNSEWQYKTIREPLDLIGLEPGEYTLEFISENTKGQNGQLAIQIVIKGPWYKSNWIYLLGFILVLAALRFLINWRAKQRNKKVLFEKLMSENELKAIRAQINPQFIQNTFDHITELIQKNEVKDHAIKSLREISVYMRQVLNMTEESLITIEEELDYTELYLRTQSLIKPGLFSYVIDVADNVDTIGIHLPAMLLQPVAENCIKYGFAERKTGGQISIKVTEQDNTIIITVTDNGSPLNAQGKAVNRNIQEVVSLTKKRLALSIGEQTKLRAMVEAKEHKTADGNQLNFTIRIPIP
ncbi:MAG: histidine kinase [Bacteroidetes bacterium]|nr:histidine kinase [Bacteroidota bacterium]